MKNEYCYEHCKGILGVKTNISNFKWVYGSIAPAVSTDAYEKCAVKFEIRIKRESELDAIGKYDGKFQSYFWNEQSHTVSFRRTFFGCIQIGYTIRIKDNLVIADIGSNYYRLVKKRVMNLHDAYYLLSDLANLILLKNGYLTLYAAGVHYSPLNKGIVCFAAPGTGKTETAMGLCEREGYSLSGEDIIITKDRQLYACPWTSSYRKKKSFLDSTGALSRVSKRVVGKVCDACRVTDLATLAAGDKSIQDDKEELLRQITIFNGYLFHYYSSPIVKVLSYFDREYDGEWNLYAKGILKQLVDDSECHIIHTGDAMEFCDIVHRIVAGGGA